MLDAIDSIDTLSDWWFYQSANWRVNVDKTLSKVIAYR